MLPALDRSPVLAHQVTHRLLGEPERNLALDHQFRRVAGHRNGFGFVMSQPLSRLKSDRRYLRVAR
jgi:hypothetical protein